MSGLDCCFFSFLPTLSRLPPWFYYPFEAHLDQSLKYCNLAVLASDEPAWNRSSNHENEMVSREQREKQDFQGVCPSCSGTEFRVVQSKAEPSTAALFPCRWLCPAFCLLNCRLIFIYVFCTLSAQYLIFLKPNKSSLTDIKKGSRILYLGRGPLK